MDKQNDILISVNGLKKHFNIQKTVLCRKKGTVKAVDGVSFDIRNGETLGLVGESGCGKSTTGRLLIRLLEPTGGNVTFEGRDIFTLKRNEMRLLRKDMQIIFQDPFASLNPRLKVKAIISEPMQIFREMSKEEIEKRAYMLLDVVGLSKYYADRYPHEFSGGQRQRVGIARALALNPKFVVCDEPVSALDVSVQAQVLTLMKELRKEFGLTYLFISHDLAVINHISDRVGVMYLGRIVELADKEEIYKNPLHPYTKALLSAIPIPDPKLNKQRIILEGDIPSPLNMPSGCHFQGRCKYVRDICIKEAPSMFETGSSHKVACHIYSR